MKLYKFHLRYHPPGLLLEYSQSGIKKVKTVDLLDLSTRQKFKNFRYIYMISKLL